MSKTAISPMRPNFKYSTNPNNQTTTSNTFWGGGYPTSSWKNTNIENTNSPRKGGKTNRSPSQSPTFGGGTILEETKYSPDWEKEVTTNEISKGIQGCEGTFK